MPRRKPAPGQLTIWDDWRTPIHPADIAYVTHSGWICLHSKRMLNPLYYRVEGTPNPCPQQP